MSNKRHPWLPDHIVGIVSFASFACELLIKVQQSPDNHTMLNHTTLLFAPNLPGIKWNVNKFALIIAQKSPDNHTYLFLFSTFTALIHQLLANRKYFLWFWSFRDHLSQSITGKLIKSNMSDYPPLHPNFVTNGKVMKHEYFPLYV